MLDPGQAPEARLAAVTLGPSYPRFTPALVGHGVTHLVVGAQLMTLADGGATSVVGTQRLTFPVGAATVGGLLAGGTSRRVVLCLVKGAALGEGKRPVAVGTSGAGLCIGTLAAVEVTPRVGVHKGMVAVAGGQLEVDARGAGLGALPNEVDPQAALHGARRLLHLTFVDVCLAVGGADGLAGGGAVGGADAVANLAPRPVLAHHVLTQVAVSSGGDDYELLLAAGGHLQEAFVEVGDPVSTTHLTVHLGTSFRTHTPAHTVLSSLAHPVEVTLLVLTPAAASSVSDRDIAVDPAGLGPQVALVVVRDAVRATDGVQVGGTLRTLTNRSSLPLHTHAPVTTHMTSTGAFLSTDTDVADEDVHLLEADGPLQLTQVVVRVSVSATNGANHELARRRTLAPRDPQLVDVALLPWQARQPVAGVQTHVTGPTVDDGQLLPRLASLHLHHTFVRISFPVRGTDGVELLRTDVVATTDGSSLPVQLATLSFWARHVLTRVTLAQVLDFQVSFCSAGVTSEVTFVRVVEAVRATHWH